MVEPYGAMAQRVMPKRRSADWWRTPDLVFDPATGRPMRQLGGSESPWLSPFESRTELPDYAREEFGDDSGSFYREYQRQEAASGPDGGGGDTFVNQLRSSFRANQREMADRTRALDDLASFRQDLRNSLNSVGASSESNLIRSELSRRASPDYRAITIAEEAAARNTLAQNAARELAAIRFNAASRGTLESGATDASTAYTTNMANASALRLAADIDARNEAARQSALTSLGDYTAREDELRRALLNDVGRVDAMRAGILTGTDYTPTDFFALNELVHQRSREMQQLAMAEQYLEQLEKSQELDGVDLANIAIGLVGTNAYEILFNLLGIG